MLWPFGEPFLSAWRQQRLRVHPTLGAAGLLTTWGRVHGQVVLEVFGHHAWILPDGREPQFRAELEVLLADLGLTPAGRRNPG